MEPLKPSLRRDILAANPTAAAEDIEEYERLLSKRFTVDPDFPQAGAGARALGGPTPDDEQRIRELRAKLFGTTGSTP